jgi:hypothetical protein
MAQKYFRNVPNFEYVNRTKDGQNISDYTEVKNIFKRAKLREDIFQDLTYFTKYQVVGDARPDNVAFEVYGDANLDWLVMLCNNIMNLETEWPLTQESFDNYVMNKYGSYEQINATRHYETVEIQDSNKKVIVPAGLEVPSNYSITFYDSGLGQMITESKVYPVSNFEYESKLQEQKRNIYLLKANYIGIVIDDIEEIMPYTSGSSQYISDRLVRGENVRLYN